MSKFQRALDNYINGNYSDFREDLEGFTKSELIAFVTFMKNESYLKIGNALATIANHLKVIEDSKS
jgi:hypothetical protein